MERQGQAGMRGGDGGRWEAGGKPVSPPGARGAASEFSVHAYVTHHVGHVFLLLELIVKIPD